MSLTEVASEEEVRVFEPLLLLHHEHHVPEVHPLGPRPHRQRRGTHQVVHVTELPLFRSSDGLQGSFIGLLVSEIIGYLQSKAINICFKLIHLILSASSL